jgi:hypothetical protein
VAAQALRLVLVNVRKVWGMMPRKIVAHLLPLAMLLL